MEEMETISGNLRLDMKRLQMPGTFVTVMCPNCKVGIEIEMIDQIEYPDEHEQNVGCYCPKCDEEISREIKIKSVIVTLEVGDAKIV